MGRCVSLMKKRRAMAEEVQSRGRKCFLRGSLRKWHERYEQIDRVRTSVAYSHRDRQLMKAVLGGLVKYQSWMQNAT